jgi:hypothetical protein
VSILSQFFLFRSAAVIDFVHSLLGGAADEPNAALLRGRDQGRRRLIVHMACKVFARVCGSDDFADAGLVKAFEAGVAFEVF